MLYYLPCIIRLLWHEDNRLSNSNSRKWVGYLRCRYIFIKDSFFQVVCGRFWILSRMTQFVWFFRVCDNRRDVNMNYNHNKPMLLFKVSNVPYNTYFPLSSTSVLKILFLILLNSLLIWQVRKLVCPLTTAMQAIKSILFLVPESSHPSSLSFLKVHRLLSVYKDQF